MNTLLFYLSLFCNNDNKHRVVCTKAQQTFNRVDRVSTQQMQQAKHLNCFCPRLSPCRSQKVQVGGVGHSTLFVYSVTCNCKLHNWGIRVILLFLIEILRNGRNTWRKTKEGRMDPQFLRRLRPVIGGDRLH